jgi:hypothetical protein
LWQWQFTRWRRVGNDREPRGLLREIAVVARMVASVVEVHEECRSHDHRNADQFRDERKGQKKCERGRAHAADGALPQDRCECFLPRAVTQAAFVKLVEDCPPFDVFRLFPLVEFIEMFLLGLDVAGKLDFGGAEGVEPFANTAFPCRLR